MKKTIKQLLFALLLGTIFVSCKKDENQIFFEGGTAPVMTSSATGPFVLDIAHKNDLLTTLHWTNPDYKFTTGVSSQDVYYTIQIDSVGKNFSSPGLAEISVPKELSKDITVGELNSKLLSAGWVENIAGTVEMRVKSALVTGAGALYSSAITLSVTPYLDVLYPVPANLYITGAATPAGWQCGCGEPELLSQKFTKVSSSQFKLTVHLNGGQSYLFIPVYGSWAHKYAGPSPNNSNNPFGDNFTPDTGGDFAAPGASGDYTITVDFKTGKFTVTP